MALLARAGCETGTAFNGDVDLETGYLAMLGVSAKNFAFHVMHRGPRALMIATELCRDPRPFEQKSFAVILTHSFRNDSQIRESYYYLTNQNGQLLNAVQFQEGRAHLFAYADLAPPVRRADFESEKAIWLSKIDRQ
ncbi:MAG TPA: hypothetical protein VMH84_08645 [Xanthobacteraceae bacterium]|nr:hypothetical protein [Xanthobacteraceae bacterium]